ncbi:MAG: MEKHLA domain-containing protein [Rhodobacteraceae bacterium]|nr:MEKHLA domain-containing protein [Paracoccaceae bacterium]
MDEPTFQNGYQNDHAELLITSFETCLCRRLVEPSNAKALYSAPYPILSHNTADDPVLTYGNLAAQHLWEMSWDDLTTLPSRLTAEPGERAQRDAMFAEMRDKGFIENYAGIRISATGKRFEIRNAVIWPLRDIEGKKVGEAATFQDYRFL